MSDKELDPSDGLVKELKHQFGTIPGDGRMLATHREVVRFIEKKIQRDNQLLASKYKSLCGCPMCEYHSEAYELTHKKPAVQP